MLNPARAISALTFLSALLGLAGVVSAATAFAAGSSLPPSDNRIVWEPELRVPRSERIFTSTHEGPRAWVGTPQGLMETLDEGATWKLIPNTGHDQLGRISDVLFAPMNSALIFLASRDKGVFRSTDGGKSWQNVGTLATGLKALQVLKLACDATDRRSRIFYATHGDAAPGISKTIDGGNSWSTVGAHLFAHEILLEGKETLLGAHPAYEEDVWSIYHSYDSGRTWTEIVRDVRATVATVDRMKPGILYFGTLKGRLMCRPPRDRYQLSGEWRIVGPEGGGEWTSLFGAFGRKPDENLVFAYDPHRYGLLVSRDGFKTCCSENSGLFVDRLVKEGANLTCSCTGKTFYASINGQLYLGRQAGADGPALTTVRVSPQVTTWVKDAPLTITAKVLPFDADAQSKIKEVQVNLGPLKGPGNFALFDDGKHNDGAAGDGVFAATYTLPAEFAPWGGCEQRQHLPGQIMLQVLARDIKGRVATDLLPVSLFPKPESFMYWDGEGARWGGRLADGRRAGQNDDRNGVVIDVEAEQRSGTRCLHVYAERGPWCAGWGSDSQGNNVSDLDYLSFWVRGQEPTTRDAKVMLCDAPGDENDASLSAGVWLIKEGYLKQFTKDYQFVRIPMAKFWTKTDFMIDQVGGIAFSGDDPKGHNFYVDDVAFEVEGSPLIVPPPPPPPKK